METQARYALVGAFVVTLLTAGLLFLFWLSDFQWDAHRSEYLIHFKGSVTGLKTGSPVRYRGVPVGTVQSIGINPKNVEEVRVMVDIDQSVPIKTDAVASLEMQGITGLSFVQLTGGTENASTLEPAKGEKYAIIASRPSKLDEVIDAAPQIVAKIIKVLDDASDLFDGQNKKAISEILGNVQAITGTLAKDTSKLEVILDQLAQATPQVTARLSEAGEVLKSYDALAQELRTVSHTINEMVGENRAGIKDFTTTGLHEAVGLVVDLRTTATTVQRFVERVQKRLDILFKAKEGGFRL